MDRKRIENAIKIIEFSNENGISIKKSAKKNGFGDTYVKNVKSSLLKEKTDGIVDIDMYNHFFKFYDEYYSSKFVIDNGKKEPWNNKINTEVRNNQMDITYQSDSNYPNGHIKTLDQLIDKCQVDLSMWSVKDYIVNKWDVTSFKSNVPKTIENFQVKARLEKKMEIQNTIDLADLFKKNILEYKTPDYKFSLNTEFEKSNNLLEICLFDTHFNKYVWHDETRDGYDVNIAEKRFLDAVSTFIERAKVFGFNRIVFPIGNDFFNSDGYNNTTTGGTPQDSQLLWHEAFRRGVKLIKDAIYVMKSTGVHVDVLVIPGNHDYTTCFYLGEYLSAWFKNDTHVSIDNNPNPRKFYNYGEVLIGFTHGSEEKRDTLPMLMANEKELWAKSNYREWHLGHFHTKKNFNYTVMEKGQKTDETDGVIIRYMSSLSGADSWHNRKGYTTNTKGGDGFIWNGEQGLVAHININIKK